MIFTLLSTPKYIIIVRGSDSERTKYYEETVIIKKCHDVACFDVNFFYLSL